MNTDKKDNPQQGGKPQQGQPQQPGKPGQHQPGKPGEGQHGGGQHK